MRRAIIGALALQIVGALVVVALISGMVYQALFTAPLAYSQAVYRADRALVRNGDTLHWTTHLRVTRAPVVVWRYRTIWSLDQQRTVWVDQNITYAIWMEPLDDIMSVIDFPLPVLPPGRYAIRVAGQSGSAATGIYQVFIHVMDRGGPR